MPMLLAAAAAAACATYYTSFTQRRTIGNVLAEREVAAHMLAARHGEVVELSDQARGAVIEVLLRRRIPPVVALAVGIVLAPLRAGRESASKGEPEGQGEFTMPTLNPTLSTLHQTCQWRASKQGRV